MTATDVNNCSVQIKYWIILIYLNAMNIINFLVGTSFKIQATEQKYTWHMKQIDRT